MCDGSDMDKCNITPLLSCACQVPGEPAFILLD